METKVTGHSHSARATLHYVMFGNKLQASYNKAHLNKNGVTVRNELVTGVNCPHTYKGAVNSFRYYDKQKPKNKVQTLNLILSFAKSDFDPSNKSDAVDMAGIGRNFVKRAFPNHQAIIAVQHDNAHAIPHLHIIVNAFDMDSLKTISGKYYGIQRLRRLSNQSLHDFEQKNERKLVDIRQRTKHATPYEKWLISALRPVLSDSSITSKAKFRRACKEHHVRASFKRAGTRRRTRRRKRTGRRRTRSGLVFKLMPTKKPKKREQSSQTRGYVQAHTLAKYEPSVSFTNVAGMITRNKKKQRKRAKIRRAERQASASQSASERASTNAIISSVSAQRSLYSSEFSETTDPASVMFNIIRYEGRYSKYIPSSSASNASTSPASSSISTSSSAPSVASSASHHTVSASVSEQISFYKSEQESEFDFGNTGAAASLLLAQVHYENSFSRYIPSSKASSASSSVGTERNDKNGLSSEERNQLKQEAQTAERQLKAPVDVSPNPAGNAESPATRIKELVATVKGLIKKIGHRTHSAVRRWLRQHRQAKMASQVKPSSSSSNQPTSLSASQQSSSSSSSSSSYNPYLDPNSPINLNNNGPEL